MEPAAFLTDVLDTVGGWVYVALFGIIFAETNLVLAPFLPGDALLFATGTLAGIGMINPLLGALAAFLASVGGDTINYTIGRVFGTRLIAKYPRLFPPRHLETTRAYMERYGGRTVFLARFVPLGRSFAPLVAGVSRMPAVTFCLFNSAGGLARVIVFVGAGYFFGRIPWVEENLTLAVLLVVCVSLSPLIIKLVRELRRRRRSGVPLESKNEENP